MGKKKSVVLMSIITIVILALCAVIALPSFVIPGSNGIKKWNPAAMQYDLGAEFSGGHYAYYYPAGVITEEEYNDNVNALEGEEKEEYESEYKQFGSLYLSTDPEDCILEDGEVTENFKTAFNKAVKVITDRFEERAKLTGSTFRVSVVDNYAIRVDLSATEDTEGYNSAAYALQAFTQYAKLGDLTIETGTDDSSDLVAELKEEGVTVDDLIKRITVKTQYKVAFLKIYFTAKGKEMIKTFKASDNTALTLKLGGETLFSISKDNINTKNEVELGMANQADKLYADTVCVLLNSVMEDGTIYINEEREEAPISFRAPTRASEVATYAPVYGDVLVWVFVAILAAIVIACVLAIVKFGGFGVMNLYTTLSYFVIVALCFAFISGGVFVFNLGSALIFLLGLVLVNVLNAYVYGAIKNEASQRKTMQSSVKGGYKKTLLTIVDVYAVLALGAVASLVCAASLFTFACQALICFAAGAFCNLLWGRVINCMLFSASKDKYKYLRLVREEDEDDE